MKNHQKAFSGRVDIDTARCRGSAGDETVAHNVLDTHNALA
jgi:hypothetical protein